MSADDVGKYVAAQYNIIQIIFEMNLKLFQTDTPKNILFVLRDWNKRREFKDSERIINNHMQKIWDDINKPENFTNIPMNKVFNIIVKKLPHFIYEKN